jgi:hypothetical protein
MSKVLPAANMRVASLAGVSASIRSPPAAALVGVDGVPQLIV